MIARRSIIGGLLAGLAAPAVIRTPGLLMPVKVPMSDRLALQEEINRSRSLLLADLNYSVPHLLTEADIEWSVNSFDWGHERGVGGTWCGLDGMPRRHAAMFSLASFKSFGPVMYDRAKARVLAHANELAHYEASERRKALA